MYASKAALNNKVCLRLFLFFSLLLIYLDTLFCTSEEQGPLEILGQQSTIWFTNCKHQTRICTEGCQPFYYDGFILMTASKASKQSK